MCFFLVSISITQCISFNVSGDSATLDNTGDTWVYQADPTANKNGFSDMTVGYLGGGCRALLAFDFSPYNGKTIDSAILNLDVISGDGYTFEIRVFRATSSWSETGVTWNNQPSFYDYSYGGVSISGTGWKTVNITTLVQGFCDSSYTNYGLVLRQYYSGSYENGGGSNRYANIGSQTRGESYDSYISIIYSEATPPIPEYAPTFTSTIDDYYVKSNENYNYQIITNTSCNVTLLNAPSGWTLTNNGTVGTHNLTGIIPGIEGEFIIRLRANIVNYTTYAYQNTTLCSINGLRNSYYKINITDDIFNNKIIGLGNNGIIIYQEESPHYELTIIPIYNIFGEILIDYDETTYLNDGTIEGIRAWDAIAINDTAFIIVFAQSSGIWCVLFDYDGNDLNVIDGLSIFADNYPCEIKLIEYLFDTNNNIYTIAGCTYYNWVDSHGTGDILAISIINSELFGTFTSYANEINQIFGSTIIREGWSYGIGYFVRIIWATTENGYDINKMSTFSINVDERIITNFGIITYNTTEAHSAISNSFIRNSVKMYDKIIITYDCMNMDINNTIIRVFNDDFSLEDEYNNLTGSVSSIYKIGNRDNWPVTYGIDKIRFICIGESAYSPWDDYYYLPIHYFAVNDSGELYIINKTYIEAVNFDYDAPNNINIVYTGNMFSNENNFAVFYKGSGIVELFELEEYDFDDEGFNGTSWYENQEILIIINTTETNPWVLNQASIIYLTTPNFYDLSNSLNAIIWLIIIFILPLVLGFKYKRVGYIMGMSISLIIFSVSMEGFIIVGICGLGGILITFFKGTKEG
jgi:hypothetical protein